jgi:hypothetical protein
LQNISQIDFSFMFDRFCQFFPYQWVRFYFVLAIPAESTKENTIFLLYFDHLFTFITSKIVQIFMIDCLEGWVVVIIAEGRKWLFV